MDPNQQPQPNPLPDQPPVPASQPPEPSAPSFPGVASSAPLVTPSPDLASITPVAPEPAPLPPTAYNPEQTQAYDPHYLDSIAPPAARPTFFSGSFGKIFFIMIGIFVLAVSLIVAFSGKDNTADLQQITVRLTNFTITTKTVQPNIKSNKLSQNNTNFQLWITSNLQQAQALLQQAGVHKSQYDKQMVASEKSISDNLNTKFDNARLNADLDRVYASTMAVETQKLITMYNIMSRKSAAKAIRSYAKTASANLIPIQKSFDGYVDDGN